MHVTTIIIFLECLGILQASFSTNDDALMTSKQRHILICLNEILQLHLTPRHTLLISLPSLPNNATVRKVTHKYPFGEDFDFHTVDAFLRKTSEDTGRSVQVSRPGAPEPETQHEDYFKFDSCVVFTGFEEKQDDEVLDSIIEQLNMLERRKTWNFKARFIVVASVAENVSLQRLGNRIFKVMWKKYSIMNVLLIITAINFKTDDTANLAPKINDSQVELQLYTWLPYTSHAYCEDLKVALIDKWTSKREFAFKAQLFPEKVPKTFHGCKSKVTTFIYPPAVTKTPDLKYTGLELKYLTIVFKKLNLTVEYNEIPYIFKSHYQQFYYAISKLQPASLDMSVGILPFGGINVSAESTRSYFDFKLKWYVPCPEHASRWRSFYQFFSLNVWMCFCLFIVLAVITMWLLARYSTKFSIRESTNYMTIMNCAYNVWAITIGISAHEKPVSNSLRMFFVVWVWYSLALTTVYQAYFVGFIVNPGFEKSLSTLNDILESGIEYGFTNDMDNIQFSDPTYDIIKKNRTTCQSIFKCLERVIRHKNFSTIADDFHVQYVSTRLLFYNIHIPICSLPNDIMRYSISTYMAKGNPLLYKFNEILKYLIEAGLFDKWNRDFLSNTRLAGQRIDNDDTNFEEIFQNNFFGDNLSYSLVHLQVVFFILLFGHAFGILVLVGEILHYRMYGSMETASS